MASLLCVLTHNGRAQREAMATMSVLEQRPDLFKLALDLMAVQGSVIAAALATAVGGGGHGGGHGAGGGAG